MNSASLWDERDSVAYKNKVSELRKKNIALFVKENPLSSGDESSEEDELNGEDESSSEGEGWDEIFIKKYSDLEWIFQYRIDRDEQLIADGTSTLVFQEEGRESVDVDARLASSLETLEKLRTLYKGVGARLAESSEGDCDRWMKNIEELRMRTNKIEAFDEVLFFETHKEKKARLTEENKELVRKEVKPALTCKRMAEKILSVFFEEVKL